MSAGRWWYKVGFSLLGICPIGAARFDSVSEARAAIRHYGDGRHRKAPITQLVITGIAGTGQTGEGADGIPATTSEIGGSYGVVAMPDGTIYFNEYLNHRLRRIGTDGIVTTVATGLASPGPMVADAQGRLYFIDDEQQVVYRYTPRSGAGIVRVAGGGSRRADGIPATDLRFDVVTGVAVAPDGTMYISDNPLHQVWRVDPEGIATVFAGTGSFGYGGDGGLATAAAFSTNWGVGVGPNGDVYLSDDRRVRKVDRAGNITTVAGNLNGLHEGDGALGIEQRLVGTTQLVATADGGLYIADADASRVYLLRRDGTMIRVAGGGSAETDGGLAEQSVLGLPWAISVGRDGTLYIADARAERIWSVHPPRPGMTPR